VHHILTLTPSSMTTILTKGTKEFLCRVLNDIYHVLNRVQNNAFVFTMLDLLKWSIDISSGMEYLGSKKVQIFVFSFVVIVFKQPLNNAGNTR